MSEDEYPIPFPHKPEAPKPHKDRWCTVCGMNSVSCICKPGVEEWRSEPKPKPKEECTLRAVLIRKGMDLQINAENERNDLKIRNAELVEMVFKHDKRASENLRDANECRDTMKGLARALAYTKDVVKTQVMGWEFEIFMKHVEKLEKG